MILVLLGTQDKPFLRLLKMVSKEIDKGNIKEKVVAQTGYTAFSDKNMESFDFKNKEEIEKLFGSEVALLVDGVTKLNKINFTSDSEASAAYQRKILVGLSEDVRVIIIKLADTTQHAYP